MYVTRKGIAVGQRFLLVMEFNIHEKKLIVSKTVSYCKKIEKFCSPNFQFGAKNESPASGNSLVVRRVSPGETKIVLF